MGQFICGKNSVFEAIKDGLPIQKLYVQKKIENINSNIKQIILPKRELDLKADANHQGFIAELKEINYENESILFSQNPEKILILDHIQDPHNLGAILRTANASGFQYVVMHKNRQAQITDTVLKVASGGFNNLKIIRTSSLSNVIQKLKKNNV
jgi:23S rRNA (guanosine2251-2'-O)-methyltransferase